MEIHPNEMSQGENDHEEVFLVSDYEEVAQLARKIFREGAQETSFSSSTPIYKLPEELRKLKKSAYTPHLIAIGPLHQNSEHLQKSMQQVKLSYTNDLLCRVSEVMEGQELAEQKNLTVLRKCMEAIKASLDDAKKCYPEEVTLDAEMMLIDGCFILEFLCRLYIFDHQLWNFYSQMVIEDPIFGNGMTFVSVQHGLILLEIPLWLGSPVLLIQRLCVSQLFIIAINFIRIWRFAFFKNLILNSVHRKEK